MTASTERNLVPSGTMSTWTFLRESILRRPEMGALFPSSRALARAMAAAVPAPAPGQVVVELGPGTGVFTRELAERFPQARHLAIEINEAFEPALRACHPAVEIAIGCASQLPTLLGAHGLLPDDVAVVVSGLPFVIFPEPLRNAIFAGITQVLRPGRHYVQFSYFRSYWESLALPGFMRIARSGRIWLNLPPATVYTFVRR